MVSNKLPQVGEERSSISLPCRGRKEGSIKARPPSTRQFIWVRDFSLYFLQIEAR